MVERTSCRHILCRWKNNFIIVFFMIPLIYIITVEIQQNLKFIGAYPTLNAKERSTVTIPESEVSIQNQSDGNNFTYHGINLMDLVSWQNYLISPSSGQGSLTWVLPCIYIETLKKRGTWKRVCIVYIWAAVRQNKQEWRAPSEDSDQPGHSPSLIRVFTVRFKTSEKPKAPPCGQRRLWSDWTDAQADLNLRRVHISFCLFCHVASHLTSSREPDKLRKKRVTTRRTVKS